MGDIGRRLIAIDGYKASLFHGLSPIVKKNNNDVWILLSRPRQTLPISQNPIMYRERRWAAMHFETPCGITPA